MRVVVVLHLLALLSAVTAMSIMPPSTANFDPNNTLTILMPDELFLDIPNRVLIHSKQPLSKVTLNITLNKVSHNGLGLTSYDAPPNSGDAAAGKYIYDLNYSVPLEISAGSWFTLNITYSYCLRGGRVNDISLTKQVRIARHFTLILSEMDKPMYRPGDVIRFRFVALNSQHVLPYTGNLTWPTHRVVGQPWSDQRIEEIAPQEGLRRRKSPWFDLIELKDTLGNVVRQWRDVEALQALRLSHKLISDAKEGKWTITARVMDESQEVAFYVRHYVLPRFTSRVDMPTEVQPTDNQVTFKVCASYTNGPAMPGSIDAQVCVCDGRIIENQRAEAKFIDKNECRQAYSTKTRTCFRHNDILAMDGCANVTVNITMLLGGTQPSWSDKLGVFVKIEEEGTGSSVVNSGVASIKMWPEPKLELQLPSTFRYGIPIEGRVVYKNTETNDTNSTNSELELTIREVVNPCGGWWGYQQSNPARLKRILTLKPGQEVLDFVIPPLWFKQSASVTVRQIQKQNVTNSTAPYPSPPFDGFIGYWLPRPRPRWDMEASQSLKLWDEFPGLGIQVRVTDLENLTCPGTVTLEVLSNQPLPDNTPLTLEFLSRGQFTRRTLTLEPNYTCSPQDGDFGHYSCDPHGEIQCLAGWEGPNCQTPVCHKPTCGEGGLCISPEKCVCKPGWTGDECETCVPREGCLNGLCVMGNDCVCKPGFIGFTCDRAVVVYERPPDDTTSVTEPDNNTSESPDPAAPIPDGTTPRRTVFKHTVTFRLDGSLGPVFRGVAFVEVDSVRASDFLSIDNLATCSSPAIADTVNSTTGLHFNKYSLIPGERLNISLNVPTKTSKTKDLDNVCILRMVDIATKNFENDDTRLIDFPTFVSKLKESNQYFSGRGIHNTESAYRAANMDITTTSPVLRKVIHCPLMQSFAVADGMPVSAMARNFKGLTGPMAAPETLQSPRIRDMFPEVWLFDFVELVNSSYDGALTVPDSLTSWEANAVCFTSDRGLWMSPEKSLLTVEMPFFVEFTPPVVARRGEILHLPVSVFVYPLKDANTTRKQCYEVDVSLEVDETDWRFVGASEFSMCICTGDLKETFKLPIRPLRIGQLNVTAKAVARLGSVMCGGDGENVVMTGDAVRRSIRVIAEGIETSVTVGGTFCTKEGAVVEEQFQTIEIPTKGLVEGSLRSYIAVSGNVIGRALANLDSLVQMPTGCGEQNLVKVAPSVYVLRHLIQGTNQSDNDQLMKRAAVYILQGFDNQLKYRHSESGAFSTFGPKYGANGSTWLTAYVFEVFSEASDLPLDRIAGRTLDAHSTLSSAFDFLKTRQSFEQGCFNESGQGFHSGMGQGTPTERRIRLTAHVLAAISAATGSIIETKGPAYSIMVDEAIRCIENSMTEAPMQEWSTLMLAKVVHAMGRVKRHASSPLLPEMIKELLSRSREDFTVSGSLRWWPAYPANSDFTSYFSRISDLEATAYALLALGAENLKREDQLATIRWVSQKQNENGGFYSTQDTVIALRALAQASSSFPSPNHPTPVQIRTQPKNRVQATLNVSPDNRFVSQLLEVGVHNASEVTTVGVTVETAHAVCITAHFTSFYNLLETNRSPTAVFAVEISTNQGGGGGSTVACTRASTTVCIRSVDGEATGMLLVTLALPSGWAVSSSELDRFPLNGSLQRIELNVAKQEISAYFTGFTDDDKDAKAEKCLTVTLLQRTFVEKAQPGVITAIDYYDTNKRVESPLELDSCHLYWNPPTGGYLNDTSSSSTTAATTTAPIITTPTPPPKVCPSCTPETPAELQELLNRSMCGFRERLHIFKPRESVNAAQSPGLIYTAVYGGQLASWNTTVKMHPTCQCAVNRTGLYGFFCENIYLGSLEIDVAGCVIVDLEDLKKVGTEFLQKAEVKATAEEDQANYAPSWCRNQKGISALLKKFKVAV